MSLECLKERALRPNVHYEKKNGLRNRFIRENPNLSIEYFDCNEEFKNIKEIWDYRDNLIEEYIASGKILISEKYYEDQDSPADKNFDKVLERVSLDDLLKKWSKDSLIFARKNLSVREFINAFA